MLENHRLESIMAYRVKDRFPRWIGRNAKGDPQTYGSSI